MGSVSFEGIVGQDRAVSILRGDIAAGRVASSYLFAGPDGVGKKAAALAFAAALNCREGGTEACGHCRSCAVIGKGIHPDVRLWQKDPAKKEFPIGLVRELIESLSLKPYEGRYKVAVVEGADAMNEAAANALLLTLEEPPPRTVIILLAAVPRLLPETVISRCRVINFAPLPEETVRDLLVAGGTEEGQAALAALMAEGSLSAAGEFLSESWQKAWKEGLELVEDILRRGPRGIRMPAVTALRTRDAGERVVEVVERIVRLALRRRLGLPGTSGDAAVVSLAGRLDNAGFAEVMERISGARRMLRGYVNPRLVVEGLVIEIAAALAGTGSGRALCPK